MQTEYAAAMTKMRKGIAAVCFFALAAAVGAVFLSYALIARREAIAGQLRGTAQAPSACASEQECPAASPAPSAAPIDFAALRRRYPDIYAWLEIPGTAVDNPLLRHPADDCYYLSHNLDGSEGYPGCLFTESCDAQDFSDFNTVIYGHNMKDGTMFGRLTQYEKSIDYLKAHPFVDFSTLWHQERYVIFAVVDVSLDTSSENFLDYFAHPRFSSDAEFASYIRRAELASMYAIPMDVKPSDALLTLSTCLEENRLVVIARRQRDGESKASLRETVNMAVRQ